MSYSSRANVQIRKILVGRGNTTVSGAYTGVRGEVTMDTDLKTLRIHDGVQQGGYIMAGQGWVQDYVANAALGNIDTTGFATTTSLNALGANVGAYQVWANAYFGTSTYGNANVAAYLLANPQGSTYSNANVAAYLLANPQGSTYSNANVAAYLLANPQGSTYSNANVLSYLTANPQPGTYSNANVAAYLIENPQGSTYSNANVQAYLGANVGAYQTWANATFSTQANATSQQIQIDSFSSNLGAYQTYANANAATQATSINSINANLGAFQTYANVTFSTQANAGTQQTQINLLNANVTAANTAISSLQGNTNKLINGSYQFVLDSQGVLNVPISQYNTSQIFAPINYNLLLGTSSKFIQIRGSDGAIIFADYTAQTTAYPGPSLLNGVNANIAAANARIITLEGNVGAYETWANATFSTVANATSQQIQIDNFNANLGAYQTYANANAATQATSINNINANTGAFQTYANATFSTVANATSQQLQINSLQANIAAANTLIYSNANVAAYLTTATINTSGNITAGNLTISNNAVILGNLRVAGTTTTVNTATLNVTDLYITVANNAVQPSDANGAGLRVAGALANITYVYPGDYWEFNKPIHANLTTGNIVFGDGTYQTTSWYANAASQQIQIDNFNANTGAFQTYANSTFVTGTPWTSAGYLTAEADTLDSVTTRGNITTNAITVGVITNTTGLKIQPDQYGENIDATGSSTPGSLLLKGKTLYLTGDAGAGPFAQAVLGPSTGMNVYLSDGFNNSTWQFANDGTFNLPNTVPGIGAVVQSTEAINIISNGHTVKLNTNGELIIENTIRTPAGQYYLAASDTSVEMSWTNATVAPSTTVYSGFNASAAGAYVTVANTDPTNNWVSKDWLFGMDGNLTVPGDIIPNVDNVHDLGSATNRFRHLYVGPGTIYVGNAAISTTATGNLLIPGLTRAVASSAYVEEVQDTGDQTYSFGTVPTVIDGAQWQQLTTGGNLPSYDPAIYSVDQLDGEGFIDGITIEFRGVGYAGDLVTYAGQRMWATESPDPFSNFNPSDWIQIPFRVQCRAGESEYEFNFSGGGGSVTSSDTPPSEPSEGALWYDQVSGRLFVWYDETWVDASIGGINSGTSANTGNITFDDVTIRGTTGTMVFQGNIDRPDLAWIITNSNEGGFDVSSLLAPMGDDQHVGEIIFSGSDGGGALVYAGNIGTPFDNAFNLVAQGANTSIKIATGNGDWQWTFGNTGNLATPYGSLILDSGYDTGVAGFVAPTGSVALGSTMLYNSGNIASQILQNREGFGSTVQISAYQDNSNPAATWTFDNTGNLTVPADSTVKSAGGDLNLYATGNVNIESKGHTFIFDTDTVGRFIMPPSGVIAGRASVDGEYDSNGLNIFVGNITTEVGSNWRFDATGNLTLPTDANINFANGVNILSTIVAGSTYSNVNVAAYVDGGITISSGPINFTASPPAYSTPGIQWINGFQSRMYGNTEVASYLVANPQSGTYSNANVQAYIGANVGAYQTWANSYFGTSSYGNTQVAAYLAANPQGSTYSNSNVASYLTAQGIAAQVQTDWNQSDSANIAYIKNKPDLTVYSTVANAAAQAVWLSNLQSNVQTINVNLGAYQTWANATFATTSALSGYATTTQFNTLNANVGAYETWANATFATASSVQTIGANLGAYQTWANANVTSLQNQITGANTNIQTFSANLGAYQTWANANASTQATSINTLDANVGAYQIWANANATTQATSISTLQTQVYSNANVIANLQNLTTNITTTGNISGNTAGFSIGYLDIPQTATNSAYVLALADRGKHIYSTTASNQNVYIPTNANAAFPVGSAVNFVLQGTGNIIITANSGVTLFLAGNSTSGANSRTLSSYGVATLQKVATNTWFGVGVGLA